MIDYKYIVAGLSAGMNVVLHLNYSMPILFFLGLVTFGLMYIAFNYIEPIFYWGSEPNVVL